MQENYKFCIRQMSEKAIAMSKDAQIIKDTSMIRIFNSAVYEDTGAERLIPLEEAHIIEQKIDANIFFEHKDIRWATCLV